MVETLCAADEAVDRAGTGVSATVVADTGLITDYINQAEGMLSAITQEDLVTDHGGYSTMTVNFLKGICSAMVGMWLADWDDAGYTSAARNQTTINLLDAEVKRGIAQLEKEGIKTFLGIST